MADESPGLADGQHSFADVRDRLAPDVTELLPVPAEAQADLTMVSMSSYLTLLWPTLNKLDPKTVCEIGADEGTTTRILAQWCQHSGRRLVVVDPTTPESAQSTDTVHYERVLSLDYLRDSEPCDLYLIDGDHNYYTVSNELAAIDGKLADDATCLLLLHDVSWPCGRRDMYYDPETIPPDHRRPIAEHDVLTLLATPDGAAGLPADEFTLVSPHPDGQAGVRTAIEYFLADRTTWGFFSIPSIHGLGVLWHPGRAGTALTRAIADLRRSFESWTPFLATLELNRLSLLEQRQKDGVQWERQHLRVQEVERDLQARDEDLQEQMVIWREAQSYIAELESRLADRESVIETQQAEAHHQAAVWQEQQDAIAGLTSRMQELGTQLQERDSTLAQTASELQRQAAVWQEQQDVIADITTRLQERDTELQERDSRMQELHTELQARTSEVQERESLLQERETLLQERDTALAESAAELQRQAAVWQEQQEVIAGLTARLQERDSTVADNTAELHRQAALWQEQQDAIAELTVQVQERDEQIHRQAVMWADQQHVLDDLGQRATRLQSELNRISTPWGWLRTKARRRR